MMARRATEADVEDLLGLYRVLVADAPIGDAENVRAVLQQPGTDIWVCATRGALVSMATLHILPNVTQGGRPYALVENVVTHRAFEGQGFGRAVMEAAVSAAWAADAYKIMLLTGKTAKAKGFYERLGFLVDEKWGLSMRRAPLRQTG